jgi:hypothetical protein
MRLRRTSSFRHRILAVLALLPFAGCPSRTDVTCGTEKVLVNGKETGVEKCTNGVVHITQSMTCESRLPRADHACTPKGVGQADCATDADCNTSANGHCELHAFGPDNEGCICDDGCKSDADCPSMLCVCDDPVGSCAITPGCRTDADCAGSFCTATLDASHLTVVACLSPDNECEIDADCSSDTCLANGPGSRRYCSSARSGCDYDP